MEKLAIGLMSGTSLDGIDVVLAKISGVDLDTKVKVLEQHTYPINDKLILKIKDAMDDVKSNSKLISSLNVELGYAFGHAVLSFCKDFNIDLNGVDFIASHGQTIYHIASDEKDYVRSSLQLGDGGVISHVCKKTVVSNFRLADMAAGGQGAPLVPYADFVLFSNKEHNRAIHNIGGIANMTFLKKSGSLDDVIAFDSGPGNMMINEACEALYHKAYDEDGLIASRGKLIPKLYESLMAHPYFQMDYPKSTGREVFGAFYISEYLKMYKDEKAEDIIHTISMITVDTIVDSYKELIKQNVDELILCGGGALNNFIKDEIAKKMPNTKVYTLENFGYSSQYKEALAFIILANQTLNHKPSNVRSATGAKAFKVLGQVNYNY